MKNVGRRIISWYKKLPEKKPYIEFITAVLTVPVLLTVIINNINTLKTTQKQTANPTAVPTVAPVVTIIRERPMQPATGSPTAPTAAVTPTPLPTQTQSCIKSVGPISIASPAENETVKGNPVCIDISYAAGNYCGVVWSSRIDNGTWSDYSNNSICYYNLSSGTRQFELKVRSVASTDEVVLTRTFVVQNTIPTPTTAVTPTQTATSSATAN